MRRRKKEHGQAIGELMISLIGLVAVMIGMLMISMLGMTGIRNTVAARETADSYSMSNVENGSLHHIAEWSCGSDGLPFTRDDSPKRGSSPNSEIFLGELTDNSGTFKTAQLARTPYAENAFESKVTESDLFLSAARLTVSRKTVNDPLARYQHFDARRVLKAFGIPSVFTIVDTVCMPVNPVEQAL